MGDTNTHTQEVDIVIAALEKDDKLRKFLNRKKIDGKFTSSRGMARLTSRLCDHFTNKSQRLFVRSHRRMRIRYIRVHGRSQMSAADEKRLTMEQAKMLCAITLFTGSRVVKTRVSLAAALSTDIACFMIRELIFIYKCMNLTLQVLDRDVGGCDDFLIDPKEVGKLMEMSCCSVIKMLIEEVYMPAESGEVLESADESPSSDDSSSSDESDSEHSEGYGDDSEAEDVVKKEVRRTLVYE